MDPGTIPIRSAALCYIDFIVLRPVGIHGGIKYDKNVFELSKMAHESRPPHPPRKKSNIKSIIRFFEICWVRGATAATTAEEFLGMAHHPPSSRIQEKTAHLG